MPVVVAGSRLMLPCTSDSDPSSYLGRLKSHLNVAFFCFSRWRLRGIMKKSIKMNCAQGNSSESLIQSDSLVH